MVGRGYMLCASNLVAVLAFSSASKHCAGIWGRRFGPPAMGVVFEHLGPDGVWTPYGAQEVQIFEQNRMANPNAVIRLPNAPFEVRFGQSARSAKMPTPPDTGIVQVNVNNENTRVVRRREEGAGAGQATVQIRVPENAAPGATIQASIPDGRVIKVTIPPGVLPGGLVTVAVPPAQPTAPAMSPQQLQPPMAAQQLQQQQQQAMMAQAQAQQQAAMMVAQQQQQRGAMLAPQGMMAAAPGQSPLQALWAAVEVREAGDLVAAALREGGPDGLARLPVDVAQQRTMVHKVCAFGRLQTLLALVDAVSATDATGACRAAVRDQPDGDGKRGLEHAVQRGHLDVVRWFVTVTKAPLLNAAALAAPGTPVAAFLAQVQPTTIPGQRLAAARALDASTNPDLGCLTTWLDDLDLEQYEADLRHIAGVDDVRTLACMEEDQLNGLAAEVGMKYGHKIKFLDACRAVRNPTVAAPQAVDAGVAEALMAKLSHLEQGMQAIDAHGAAQATAILEGLHHIDDTTTKTAADVAAVKAALGEVVDATRGQTRLLMDLCSDATECPKLVWMAREQEGTLTKWLTPSSWYGKPVRVQFVCPASMQVATSGDDGRGYRVVLPKDWIKKWGVAVNLSLTVLRVAMVAGAAAMGCYHACMPDMTIDRASLRTADELYEEVNKGLDPHQREALDKGTPEVKALSEAAFQMLRGELEKQDPGLNNTGLVKVVGGAGAALCTEWVHPDVVDEFRAKGAAMLRPKQ